MSPELPERFPDPGQTERGAPSRVWASVYAVVVLGWSAVKSGFLWVWRRGLFRTLSQAMLLIAASAWTIQDRFSEATLAVAWIILLEVSDPRRPAGVMVRRKR